MEVLLAHLQPHGKQHVIVLQCGWYASSTW
jgi:hypothetical protein